MRGRHRSHAFQPRVAFGGQIRDEPRRFVLGQRNRVPQTGWLTQEKRILSQLWRLKPEVRVWEGGVLPSQMGRARLALQLLLDAVPRHSLLGEASLDTVVAPPVMPSAGGRNPGHPVTQDTRSVWADFPGPQTVSPSPPPHRPAGFRGGARGVQGRTMRSHSSLYPPRKPCRNQPTRFLLLHSAFRRNEVLIGTRGHKVPTGLRRFGMRCQGKGTVFVNCSMVCSVAVKPPQQQTLVMDAGTGTQAARRDSPGAPRSPWKVKTQKDQKQSRGRGWARGWPSRSHF